MNRVSKCALVLTVAATSTVALSADVKTRDKTQFKLEGMLGKMAGMFGGKAAKDGLEATNAVKGHRKIELGDTTGRIIDLKEEKVYELDMKKKTYEVTTFDELRQRMRETQERMRQSTGREEGGGDKARRTSRPRNTRSTST